MPSTEPHSGSGSPSAPETPAASRGPRWIRSRPLATTNATYGTMYAVDGAMLPFLTIFLAFEEGLSTGQIGFVLAVGSVAAIVAPLVLTVLADRFGRAGLLLLSSLLASALTLLVFALVDGYWWILGVYAAFSLSREPTRPLLDGIFFMAQRAVPALGRVSYHRVRIWGTFGYMVPGVLLYFVLTDRDSLGVIPWVACGLSVLSALTAYFLPTPMRAAPHGSRSGGTTLPTMARAAGRLLRRRRTAAFVSAMFILQATFAAYAAFYPLQATEVVGISPRWLGPVTNLGVLLELGYMAGFGWLVRRLGWRRLMVVGAAAAAARYAVLAAVPTVGAVVGTQVVHGLVIVVIMVAGRVILDREAPDEIRHTTQGLYAMLVMGGGRIAGSALGGLVAAQALAAVFWSAAAAAVVAGFVLLWSVRDDDPTTASH